MDDIKARVVAVFNEHKTEMLIAVGVGIFLGGFFF
jgi:hypothetical protein